MGRSQGGQNVAKHGVPFEYATRVFLDVDRLDAEDKRCAYDEERRLTLGKIEDRLFVVAYTPRTQLIRLISARKLTTASKGNTMKRYRLDPANPRKLTAAEVRRLDAKPIDYSDIPPLGGELFARSTVDWPPPKKQLTIRLDTDVLDWLKGHGRGYQTRINRILRVAMESQPAVPIASGTSRKNESRAARRPSS